MALTAKNGILYDESGEAIGFACGRQKLVTCDWCYSPQTKLCDFPINKKTCDKKLCDRHAKHVGENKDYCPEHNLEVIEGARNFR